MKIISITVAAVLAALFTLEVHGETKSQCIARCKSDYKDCTYYATDMDACAVQYEGCSMGCSYLRYTAEARHQAHDDCKLIFQDCIANGSPDTELCAVLFEECEEKKRYQHHE